MICLILLARALLDGGVSLQRGSSKCDGPPINNILMFKRLLLIILIDPHHARRPWQGGAVTLRRSIAYKEQYCVPSWVREHFVTFRYSVNVSPATRFHFSAPDSVELNRWGIGEKKLGVIFQLANNLHRSVKIGLVKNGHFPARITAS